MRAFSLFFCMMLAAAGPASAEEVTQDYLGLELTANLEIAPGKSLKNDGVILLVHDTLGHARMEFMANLQDSLRDAGVNSLAITLGLGLDKRKGMFNCAFEQDHRHEDALDEISGWVGWLKSKGATSIVVAGHGRGANQAALYAINKLDRTVKRVILISPLMQSVEKAESLYQSRFRRPLKQELAKAEELVASDEGDQLLDVPGFLTCPNAKVTAGAFANYYGAKPTLVTTNLLPSLRIPVQIIVGDNDPNLAEIQAGAKSEGKSTPVAVIPNADQDFREGSEDLARKMREFMPQKAQG
jgi:pimeloyl-ACP methyl ester carboxylesterase